MKEYDVYNFLWIECLKFKFAMLFKHEYQSISIHNLLVGKLMFFLVLVNKKFFIKRPKICLLGIATYSTFVAYRCCMARGDLRKKRNCPGNFTHIFCTVPIFRVSFSESISYHLYLQSAA